MTNKTEKIREIIIKAVPEIVELKWGCVIEWLGPKRIVYKDEEGILYYWSGSSALNPFHKNRIEKIIGRPITLEDVLVAVDRQVLIGNGETLSYLDLVSFIYDKWQLNKTLEDQDEPTIDFLYKLLVDNKE